MVRLHGNSLVRSWHFSIKDNPVTTDDEDSDVNPTNGESDYFILDPGENDTSICALGRYGLFGPEKDRVRFYLLLALKNR